MTAPDASALCPPDQAPPQVLIYAQTNNGTALLDKLYQNIPLMLGAVFPEPYGDASYKISIETSGGRLDLVAHATDDQRMLFLTDPFTLHGP